MQELKCPNCGTIFKVDESDYARIVSQIRDKEFDVELKRREIELEEKNKNNLQIALLNKEKEQKATLDKKNLEIFEMQNLVEKFRAKLQSADNDKKIAILEALSVKEKELQEKTTAISNLQGQLKIKESENELNVKSIKDLIILSVDNDGKMFYQTKSGKCHTINNINKELSL